MGFEPPKPAEAPRDEDHDAFGDDVVEHPRAHPTGLTPVQSPVHTQQAEIADRFGDDDEGEDESSTRPPRSMSPKPKPTFDAEADVMSSLEPRFVASGEAGGRRRRSRCRRRAARRGLAPLRAARARRRSRCASIPSRHLKLRLACAVNGRSAQQIVTDALDGLLVRHARTRRHGREGQPQGIMKMSKPFRFGSAISLAALASMIAGCAAPQQATGFRRQGGWRDWPRDPRHGRAQRERCPDRDQLRRAGGRKDARRRRLPRRFSAMPISPAAGSGRPSRPIRMRCRSIPNQPQVDPEAGAGRNRARQER